MANDTLDIAYDPRFGFVQLHMESTVRVALMELLGTLKVTPDEFAALLQPNYQWTEGKTDIETARVRLLTETLCAGKTVLDIGGYDGRAAKQLLDQGAASAVCLDNQQYKHYGWADKKFEGVEYVTGDFMEWPRQGQPPFTADLCFDIVVFYNVLYHLKNPWDGLDRVRELTAPGGEMLLCTLFRYMKGSWVYLYEPKECNPTDDTVYWGFSIEALERILRATGWVFTQEGLAYDRVVYRCRPRPGFHKSHEDS